MPDRPRSVAVSWLLILLNAIIWLGLGVIIALDLHPAMPEEPLVRTIMTVLSFAAFGVLLVLIIGLRRRNNAAYLLAVGALGMVGLLTFLDDFGWPDLLFLVLTLLPLFLLIKDRAWYLASDRLDNAHNNASSAPPGP